MKDSYVLSLLDCTRKRVEVEVWGELQEYNVLQSKQIKKYTGTEFMSGKSKPN